MPKWGEGARRQRSALLPSGISRLTEQLSRHPASYLPGPHLLPCGRAKPIALGPLPSLHSSVFLPAAGSKLAEEA